MPPSTPEGTELVRKVAYHFEEIFTDDEDVIMFFTNNLEHFEDEFEEEVRSGHEESEATRLGKQTITGVSRNFSSSLHSSFCLHLSTRSSISKRE